MHDGLQQLHLLLVAGLQAAHDVLLVLPVLRHVRGQHQVHHLPLGLKAILSFWSYIVRVVVNIYADVVEYDILYQN